MTEEKMDSLVSSARNNNDISEKIVEYTVTFAQAWFSLIAPLVIGIYATFLTSQSEQYLVTGTSIAIAICLVLVHVFLVLVSRKYSSKVSLYTEIVEMKSQKEQEVEKLRNELANYKHGLRSTADIYSNQISSVYLSAHATDMAVGKLKVVEEQKLTEKQFWILAAKSLDPIIRPLVLERESLFGYRSESRYNIALYFYDNESDMLSIVWRDCDSRLPQRNRQWQPGHGHVGLAFLHKETKICPDIAKSNELSPSYESGDASNYRSFMSIPILRCDDNGDVGNELKPLGVLVLTSADKDQFQKQRDLQFLTIISKHLAIYLATVDTFLAHNTLTEDTE